MASPDLGLQKAVFDILKANGALAAAAGGRVYDEPPEKVVFPYVTIGEAQFIRNDATCREGGAVYLTMHAWSRSFGYVEVKTIAGIVVGALHLAAVPAGEWQVTSLMHRQTRTFRDPDGKTSHAVIEFVASVHKPPA